MLCRKPVTLGGGVYPCGHCLPCRVQRKSQWKTRLLLEASTHSKSCFLTLTYNDQSLPTIVVNGKETTTLDPKDLQLWLKRLRETIKPLRLRFFACGEYSPPPKNRPHYHVLIFGLPGCLNGQTRPAAAFGEHCCSNCDKYQATWTKGNVFVGTVTPQSIEYCVDYTMKKLVGKMAELYDGRRPEFSRQSNRPGIGYNLVDDVAEGIRNMEKRGQFLDDVPIGLKFGARQHPLNPLFRRKVRLALGREPTAPKEFQLKRSERMLDLRMVSRVSETSLAKLSALSTSQKALNQASRLNIHKTRKKL